MTLFRHKASLKHPERVVITVYPDDDRHPETFVAAPAELRRFAWALLADFDPDEAQAVALETGQDIKALAAWAGPARGATAKHPVERAGRTHKRLKATSDSYRVLQILAGQARAVTSTDIAATLTVRRKGGVSSVLTDLGAMGLARRVNAGGQGVSGRWLITLAGRAELAGESRAQQAAA